MDYVILGIMCMCLGSLYTWGHACTCANGIISTLFLREGLMELECANIVGLGRQLLSYLVSMNGTLGIHMHGNMPELLFKGQNKLKSYSQRDRNKDD